MAGEAGFDDLVYPHVDTPRHQAQIHVAESQLCPMPRTLHDFSAFVRVSSGSPQLRHNGIREPASASQVPRTALRHVTCCDCAR
jgi:hypothetical protein